MIKRDGLQYDCGVELSPEGQFGRQDYKQHACRGTYTLHSLYLLLWANFGAFCMALLTQPDSDERIHGVVISEWLSVRHYCLSQLKTVWLHMRNNMGLSEEQRAFFVTQALSRLRQVRDWLVGGCGWWVGMAGTLRGAVTYVLHGSGCDYRAISPQSLSHLPGVCSSEE